MVPMKKNLLIIGSLCLCTLIACTRPADIAGNLWFYTHSSGTNLPDTLTPANFILLEKDGTYTSDLKTFDYGKWVYNNHQLLLISHRQTKTVILVNYLTDKEMQAGPPSGPFNNFESQQVAFDFPAQNPFSKDNNQWRMKATQKETSDQIRIRLLNHFKFWELYFTWALNNKIQYIDVRSTASPIKIYGNGFALKPFEQLPTLWKMYFYDDADCAADNEKIKYIFDHNLVSWPQTENKYKMFVSAFQQMQQHLQ